MPDAATRRRAAQIADVGRALAAARCAVRLVGPGTGECVVRALLLSVMDQINRAERALASLVSTSHGDGFA
jgi:hypothetical protein